VCDALRQSGLGHFVHEAFNMQGLSAHVRQLERDHAEELVNGEVPDTSALLSPALAAVLNVNPTYKVIGRRRPVKKN
jgi:hypothetical protein